MQVRFVEILADFNSCVFLASSSQEFEPLLSWSFWLIPQEWYTTDPSLVYPSTMTTECYDEQLSDKCLTLLLGTWYEPTPTPQRVRLQRLFTVLVPLHLDCWTVQIIHRPQPVF